MLKQFSLLEVDFLIFICITTRVIWVTHKKKFEESGFSIQNGDGSVIISSIEGTTKQNLALFINKLAEPKTLDSNEITLKID